MGKGFGIAGLVLAIVGIFVPVFGLFIGWAGLILATVAAFAGQRGLAIGTSLICVVVFIFLTPSLWLEGAAVAVDAAQNEPTPIFRIISIILVVAPFVGVFFGKRIKE